MLPNPLHPAVVHFAIALAVLMPLFILVAAVAIRRGSPARQTWGAVLALQLLLILSSWAAMETGENEEEKVEEVVAEHAIEEHEEAAEFFLVLTGVTLLLSGAGLLSGGKGEAGRYVALVASLAVLGAGARVGHLGGELVYKHGAAQAYVQSAGNSALESGEVSKDKKSDDDDDDDHDKQNAAPSVEPLTPSDSQAVGTENAVQDPSASSDGKSDKRHDESGEKDDKD